MDENQAVRMYLKAQTARDRMIWWERGLARWIQGWMFIVAIWWVVLPCSKILGVYAEWILWVVAGVSGFGCLLIDLLLFCTAKKWGWERKRVMWERRYTEVRSAE